MNSCFTKKMTQIKFLVHMSQLWGCHFDSIQMGDGEGVLFLSFPKLSQPRLPKKFSPVTADPPRQGPKRCVGHVLLVADQHDVRQPTPQRRGGSAITAAARRQSPVSSVEAIEREKALQAVLAQIWVHAVMATALILAKNCMENSSR